MCLPSTRVGDCDKNGVGSKIKKESESKMKSRKEKQDGRGDEDGDKGRYHREIWRETELHKGRGRGEHL